MLGETALASVEMSAYYAILNRVWVVGVFSTMVFGFWRLPHTWRDSRGWESEDIARNLADGHGFSFAASSAWLFRPSSSTHYQATAWKEPLYPFLMALSFRFMGDSGRIAILALQMLSLGASAFLLRKVGSHLFDPWTGMVSGGLLAVLPAARYIAGHDLDSAILGGFLITLMFWLLLWCEQQPDWHRSLILGAVMGLTGLTVSPALAIAPAFVLFFFKSHKTRRAQPIWLAIFFLLGLSLSLLPWTLRNRSVFGHWVPLRSGFGQIVHFGNPILAETVNPSWNICRDETEPPWTAAGPLEAIQRARNLKYQALLYARAEDCIEKNAPSGYENFNEVERDKIRLTEAMAFVGVHPEFFFSLTLYKAFLFFYGEGGKAGWLGLVGLIAGFLVKGRMKAVLLASVIPFAVPYTLGMPFYYRYRYPIDPLLVLLFSALLVQWGGWTFRNKRSELNV